MGSSEVNGSPTRSRSSCLTLFCILNGLTCVFGICILAGTAWHFDEALKWSVATPLLVFGALGCIKVSLLPFIFKCCNAIFAFAYLGVILAVAIADFSLGFPVMFKVGRVGEGVAVSFFGLTEAVLLVCAFVEVQNRDDRY
ncbi:unnamed protein product [Rodentolepis nana]|uniref:MARVEL domain-containing protein n=1 Tax=Rodentolepis nana TaxID=102285 RepID=A0A0R3TT24_RODNA|nr:unnamed protein product [Rodentolepis nana]